MNPELTCSLPKFLTACGVVDMFSHVCERYFSPDGEIGVINCSDGRTVYEAYEYTWINV